jgi:predicted transcriptional regulator
MELTKRQQEAFNVIKEAGAGGIGFKELRKKLKIKGLSTLRQRLGELKKHKAVTSTLNGKTATYRAAAPA